MKLFFITLLAAFVAGDDGESYIEEQLSKIKSIDAPFTTKRPPVEGSGSISWKTRTFSDKQENFVLVRSQNEYCDDIQLISMMRFNGKTKMWTETILDDAYSKRASIKNQGGNTFQVTVTDVTKSDRWYYVMYSTNDPFDGVIIEVDDYMYQANIYQGKVGAKYHKMGDDWLLFGYQEATEEVSDLKISNGVPFTTATAAQKSSAGLPDSVSAIVAKRPGDDWFSTNRALDSLTVSTSFSSEKVLRFFDLADAKSDLKPVMVGWEVTIKCGPIPPSADEVEVFSKGKKMETTIMGREHISASTIEGDYIRLAKVKATSEMDAKVGAVSCRFYSSDDRILGMSKPTSYAVHSEESPRPSFEAEYKLPTCGLDVSANSQEVAFCQVPDGQKSNVFPPVELQWEITKSDGTKVVYPEVPKETMFLPLSVKIDESLRGAKATCLDWRSGDPAQPATYAVTEPGRTVPSNSGSGINIRKYTNNVVISIKNNEVTCTSDMFGTETAAENECSDVQKWNEADTTICPYTKTFGNVTCSAEMTNGQTKIQNYDNKDCIESNHEIQIPCTKSALVSCDPHPGSDAEEIAEGGSSKLWLLFFVIAAAGGALLIFINKKKNNTDTPSKDSDDDTDSLRRLSDIEIKVTPPKPVAPTLAEIVEETPVQSKKNFTPEVPKSDPTNDTQNDDHKNQQGHVSPDETESIPMKIEETDNDTETNDTTDEANSELKHDEEVPDKIDSPVNTSALSYDEKDESIPMIDQSDKE